MRKIGQEGADWSARRARGELLREIAPLLCPGELAEVRSGRSGHQQRCLDGQAAAHLWSICAERGLLLERLERRSL